MRVTRFIVKTLREAPTGAELPSHSCLLRGGYVKPLASGLYSVLPLGKRVLQKIEAVIRDEMNRLGGQEVELPVAQPSEWGEESGRYAAIGPELRRFKDRRTTARKGGRDARGIGDITGTLRVLKAGSVGRGPEKHELVRAMADALEPLTIDEAIVRLEKHQEKFLVFSNRGTDRIHIVYRDEGGDYGVLNLHATS